MNGAARFFQALESMKRIMTRQSLLRHLANSLFARHCTHPLRGAIDGIDAAGKTTLANELAPLIEAQGRPAIRASIDDFHRPRAERYRQGPASPGRLL